MSLAKFVTVDTEHGPVRGVLDSNVHGRDIFKFKAIPYMRAPIGKLRFRDAQAPEKWTEPLDTNIPRPTYCSYSMMTQQVDGTEDAGVLSVYTPYLDRKLPVAVYIHGGGFQFGFGLDGMYGGDHLLQKDIIYVTINYRVGPIGFLSLKDPKLGIPGNAGLKDQVVALKWIKKNISNFGGDADNITVFGTSAGGTSVHHLMISNQAKGLFHKAIPMSGTALIRGWAMAPKKDLTERLAKAVGWNGEGGEARMLEVLENASAKDLVEKENSILTTEEKFAEHILFPFTPCVEPYASENTFLAEDPVLAARSAWGNDIDCMIGGTTCEGGLLVMTPGNYFDYLNTPEAFTLAREFSLDLTKSADKQKAIKIGEKFKKLYFGDADLSAETYNQYLEFAGDLHFWQGIYRAILSRLESRGKGKTFLYRFDLQTDLNFIRHMLPHVKLEGACHGECLGYLFYTTLFGGKPPSIDSKEFGLVKRMVSIITSFIISGTPDEPSWEPLTSKSPMACLNMTNDAFETVDFPEEKRLKALNEIYSDAGVSIY